jgi:hypothetical protein
MSDTVLYLPVQTISGMPYHGFKMKEEAMFKLVGNLNTNTLHNIRGGADKSLAQPLLLYMLSRCVQALDRYIYFLFVFDSIELFHRAEFEFIMI